ncbi:hypothetical protein B0H16DRAFT_1770257 [Mycena metata]|uniref:Uncharacterized protein n=1 Tax=Mycena metata TaxID=1033252 RepID=A0AAD7MU92_9AGAR|nr:hypothetical protein B0H16DRAFT_1770257 [Mycena metata]
MAVVLGTESAVTTAAATGDEDGGEGGGEGGDLLEEDWWDDNTDGGETDDEWEDAQSSVEVEQDDDKSTEDSDANEDEGLLNFSTEPHEPNTAKDCQEPAHIVDQDPNPAESRVIRTGIGFIHRIIRGFQQGLVTESEDLDTDPISPFLISLSLATGFGHLCCVGFLFSNCSAHVNIAVDTTGNNPGT